MTSYGGFLRYEVLFVLPRNESVETEAIIEPDLILQVNLILLSYLMSVTVITIYTLNIGMP